MAVLPGNPDPTGVSILGNSIFDGAGDGIDLGGDGRTSNTIGGPHVGPNNLQSYPVLTSAARGPAGGPPIITGTLNSTPNTKGFRVEFFATPHADLLPFGDGQIYLGFTMVDTDSSGNASFSAPVDALPAGGALVTATATDPAGNTSEFSGPVGAGAPSVDVSPSVTATPSPAIEGQVLTYLVTVTNHTSLPASDVTLIDEFPEGADLVSADGSIMPENGGNLTFPWAPSPRAPPRR